MNMIFHILSEEFRQPIAINKFTHVVRLKKDDLLKKILER